MSAGSWETSDAHAERAARFLEDFKVPQGEYLLSNAANSVLGRELIQMAQRRGTKLINVVRRREVVPELHKLGCAATPPRGGNLAVDWPVEIALWVCRHALQRQT